MKIHFDLEGQEEWHRREWERRIASFGVSASAQIATDGASADFTIHPGGAQFNHVGFRRHFAREGAPRKGHFVWDHGDFPTGRWPGLYCSLSKGLFEQRRHRTFAYPIIYNECVEPGDFAAPDFLYGFVGGISSGLRGRLVAAIQSDAAAGTALVKIQQGPWKQFFDRSGVPAKLEYAEALRRCRFFLCPRGNGVGSIRLFETMQAARVPVIVSDGYVLPEGIDWPNCSVRILEKDITGVPALLKARADDWERLARNAQLEWTRHYSDRSILAEIAAHLTALESAGGSGSETGHFLRMVPAMGKWHAKALLRKARTLKLRNGNI